MSKLEALIERLCPEGVEWKTLDEVFTIRNGYTPSKANPDYWEGGTIPWFRMDDIRTNGRILEDSIQHITPAGVKGKLFEKDSIILATTATIGEHALLMADALANQRFTNFAICKSLKERLLPKFAFYYFFMIDEWCKKNTRVSSFPSVDMKKLKKQPFPLPPLEVQREVVGILDLFTGLTAELTAELELRKKQYAYYREVLLSFDEKSPSVIKEMTKRLCPNGIEYKTIKEVSRKTCSGGTPNSSNRDYYKGDIPWLRTQEVDFNEIYETELKISEDALKNSSAKWIPANCVIVAMYGATAAKVAINRIPLTTNQACCNLEIDANKAHYKYVYYCLCNQYEDLKAKGRGTQSNINKAIVEQQIIPLPPLEIQHKIVEILDKFDTLTTSLTEGIPAEIEARRKQYTYYRNKLLTFKDLAPSPKE